jgi:phosphoglucosamine mutase
MQKFPQVMINVKTTKKVDIDKDDIIRTSVKAAEDELAGTGRVLLRASGTEPVIRVMVEGQNHDMVDRLALKLAKVVETAAS